MDAKRAAMLVNAIFDAERRIGNYVISSDELRNKVQDDPYVAQQIKHIENWENEQASSIPDVLVSNTDEKVGEIVFKKGSKIYKCKCGILIGFKDNFCRHCGQKQDWNSL